MRCGCLHCRLFLADSGGRNSAGERVALAVYKSPTCGCCGDWIEHLEERGFITETHHPENLSALKDDKGVPPEARSCHTAVSAQGYLFEGHVPALFIRRFLQAPPAGARGLTVPGMPIGSPGMEIDDKFTPYDILLVNADGSTEVFASIARYQDQFAAGEPQ